MLNRRSYSDRKAQVELDCLADTTEEAQPLFHSSMSSRYHEEVQHQVESLNAEEYRTEVAKLIRSLVHRIVLTSTAERNALMVYLHGDLAGILSISTEEE